MKQIKQAGLIFLACGAGAVFLQLAAPLLLGIIVQAASFVVPLCLYHFIVKKHWRVQLVRDEAEKKTEGDKKSEQEPDEVSIWYATQGKQRIERILLELYGRGIFECWVRKDGIINVRTQNGYRRAGNLPGYPGSDVDKVSVLIRKDGIGAINRGKYLHLSWGEE